MDWIKDKIKKENLLGYGSSRIVFDLNNNFVAKIPYNNLGILANKKEFEFYKNNKDIIAKVEKYENNIIIQEKLSNIITVPYKYTLNNKISEYLKENYPNYDFSYLINKNLNTRFQVGMNKNNEYKFFDYEDSKIEWKSILNPFKMDDRWINMFIDYYKENDLFEITERETFEDNRGFLCDYE